MLNVVILAAGQGTRMKSDLPKVLHPVGAKPMLAHVLDTARQLQPHRLVVIYGHGGQSVIDTLGADDVIWAEQAEQLGTGHAVAQGLHALSDEGTALILYGDVPLTRVETLQRLLAKVDANSLALLTVELDDPTGYGRILRDNTGNVTCIREEKDASAEEKQVTEVNTGILAVTAHKLHGWLDKLENNNAQGEYYLTDIIAMAVAEGMQVKTAQPQVVEEVLGVNSKTQLAYLERYFQFQQAEELMTNGVTVIDPARIDVRGTVRAGRDVTIDINVVLEGDIDIGNNVSIGAGCVLRNVKIDNGVQILPMCVIENAQLGADSRIGPYSRIRPGAVLSGDNHVGNFVEIKNSTLGQGSKVNHLTYIGDTDMGSGVNIGAGTITANYDGANKHRTVIEDKVSTGSNTVMVAPVKVGKGATLGAGTVLRKDAPPGELTLTVSTQKTIKGWKRPQKKP
jgi:bifunctional UDP-N-acetylglucosamine pyrophosphorylase/glucosamine-1-phosphate N-acetyltransferase